MRFSDEINHNLLKSPCVHDKCNQLIIVDNTSNVFFRSLGEAVNHGIDQAVHDLIAIVHEDVLLLPGWQKLFDKSLAELEIHDPDWGLIGSVGWDSNGITAGHYSDPHRYENKFSEKPFGEVQRLDEQLLVIRKSSGLHLDSNLPSIHNIGADLANSLSNLGRKTYAIDAPTIHKYANAVGELIQSAEESPKIQDRKSLTYLSDKDCCDEYFFAKWNLDPPKPIVVDELKTDADLDSPVILLGRGGGGSRLLSVMAEDTGLFTGNNTNVSGDCMEMVAPVYRSIIRKHMCRNSAQQELCVKDLRASASHMIAGLSTENLWGFKLPETLLILPEIHRAFPNACYVHFKRPPADTALRRTHMTARLDNHIGRTALRAAYDFFLLPRNKILTDNDQVRMLTTTVHQLAKVEMLQREVNKSRWLELDFDATVSSPLSQLELLSRFCGLEIIANRIGEVIDQNRVKNERLKFSSEQIRSVEKELAQLMDLAAMVQHDAVTG